MKTGEMCSRNVSLFRELYDSVTVCYKTVTLCYQCIEPNSHYIQNIKVSLI